MFWRCKNEKVIAAAAEERLLLSLYGTDTYTHTKSTRSAHARAPAKHPARPPTHRSIYIMNVIL